MKKHLLFALLFLCGLFANAQWSSNPAVNTPVSVKANQESQEIAISDGSGGTIIAWAESGGFVSKIYVQKLNSAGIKQWGNDGVLVSDSPNSLQFPILTSDGNGGVVVAWDESASGFIFADNIYAQRINAAGTRLWGNTGAPVCVADGLQFLSNIITDSSGNFVLSWMEFEENKSKIFVQKLNSSGAPQWTTNGLLITDHEGEYFGSVFDDPTGGYTVLFEEDIAGTPFNSTKMYWQKLNADGTRKTPSNTLILEYPGTSAYSFVNGWAPDGNGGLYFAVVSDDNATAKLYLQHVLANGTSTFNTTTYGIEVDASIGVASNGAGGSSVDYSVGMETDNNGGVVLGWTDVRSATLGMYLQRFNSAGTKLWNAADVKLFSDAVDLNGDFSVAKTTLGEFVILASKSVATAEHYYVQKVDASGNLQYPATGVAVSTASSTKNGGIVATGDKVVVVWSDSRGGSTTNQDIYAQSVYNSGVLPVDFIDFTASYRDSKVFLSWSTATEFNNALYIIEKSENGNEFYSIGSVKGVGSSEAEHSYAFSDLTSASVSGTLYYRIKQVDVDGKFDYSDVKSVKIQTLNSLKAVSFYPNPVKDVVNLSLSNPADVILSYSVFDNTGKQVLGGKTAGASNKAELNLSALSHGQYIVSLVTNSGIYKEKIVIN